MQITDRALRYRAYRLVGVAYACMHAGFNLISQPVRLRSVGWYGASMHAGFNLISHPSALRHLL